MVRMMEDQTALSHFKVVPVKAFEEAETQARDSDCITLELDVSSRGVVNLASFSWPSQK